MKVRKLRAEEVKFTIEVEAEDTPLKGNVLASGDEAVDKEAEEEVIRRLRKGDVWAWCSVKVMAEWRGWRAEDSLGCCSYDDVEDFMKGDYYKDMKVACLVELNRKIAEEAKSLSELEVKP